MKDFRKNTRSSGVAHSSKARCPRLCCEWIAQRLAALYGNKGKVIFARIGLRPVYILVSKLIAPLKVTMLKFLKEPMCSKK